MNRIAPLLSAALVAACTPGATSPGPEPRVEAAPGSAEPSPKPEPQSVGPSAASPPSKGAEAAPSYFPLLDGASYEYRGVFKGRTYEETITVRRALVGGEEIFYFVKPSEMRADAFTLENSIGDGVFALRPDGVYSGSMSFLSQVPTFRTVTLKRVLPLPLQAKARAEVTFGSVIPMTRVYVVDGFEAVTVPAGTFPGCAKITFTTTIESEASTNQIWLAPRIGLVKWRRSTGRIDELVSHRMPS